MMVDALRWLALALMGAAMVGAFGAVTARSLIATCMHLLAAGAAVAAVILLLGAGEGAVAIALLAVAWTPVLLLAAMLLSTRAVKARGRTTWLTWLAAAAAVVLAWWPLGELHVQGETTNAAAVGFGFWVAPLLLVVAATCLGLLGYGERGALARGDGA